ncbi:glycosyltransferase family 2 protein [Micromonospora haikouensis]|uniref:glycosyltransferase family 2 protein n=1 Tax=Micromonospora haikouensis TaxID=686309 RepID=UPI00378D4FDA
MISIVVPTLGRDSLGDLLTTLAVQVGDRPDLEILLVDDRSTGGGELPVPGALTAYTKVLRGHGAGPAAARNLGWRAARFPWVAFLDDDVLPASDWLDRLIADLAVPERVGGVQGVVRVPLSAGRRPTDWERATAGLADGEWITADMAYRRAALAAVGGFDERFPRAYREDSELAHRVRCAGWRLTRGTRTVTHPVRAESRWVSLRTQRGNADDALLRHLYGSGWRGRLGVPAGRRHRHAVITAAGALTVVALASGLAARRSRVGRPFAGTATLAAAVWLAGTVRFASERIAPGPRTRSEVAAMLATSAAIPPLAVTYWLRGWWCGRHEVPCPVVRRRDGVR